jgi:hypothetical protein
MRQQNVFFADGLKSTGAQPLLWTTGLMAPEAYTLKAALDGWIAGESAVGARGNARQQRMRSTKNVA